MIRKNWLLILIFFFLAIIALWYYFSNQSSTYKEDDTSFRISDTAIVTSIQFSRNDTVHTLTRNDAHWEFDRTFNANPAMVGLLFRIFQQVEIKSALSPKLGQIIADTIIKRGNEIKVYSDGKIIKDLYIYADANSQSIFFMSAKSKRPFLVTLPSFKGNFAGLFLTDIQYWRDKTIISLTAEEIMEIRLENNVNEEMSFQIKKNDGSKPELYNSHQQVISYNSEAMDAYLFCFRNIKVERYIEKESVLLDSLKRVKSNYKISIKDISEKSKTLEFFDKSQLVGNKITADINFCYALLNNEKLVLIKYIEADPITRDISFFIK